jgi:transposase
MKVRERWRCGLRLGKGEALAVHNARTRAQEEGNERFSRKLRAILLVGQDHLTQTAAAKILEVVPNSITRWVMTYVKRGIDGLRPKEMPGRQSRLNPDQEHRLSKIIENGPERLGLDTGVWTGPIIRDVIERRFKVKYSVEQARRILHKLGFSVQYPKHVLSEASQREQDRWLRHVLPGIKKKRKRKAA